MNPLDHALALADLGLHVFPLTPATPGDSATGKRPLDGVKWKDAATTDPTQITAWWSATPEANIGIACGPSGLVVIDEDEPGALDRFAADRGQTVPATYTVTTGRGRHLYYLAPGPEVGNRPGALKGHKIDVRGSGGYVVGPGSIHASGHVYTADNAPCVPLAAWLADALAEQPAAAQPATSPLPWEPAAGSTRYAATALAEEAERVRSAVEGTRNHTLNEAAFALGQLIPAGQLDEAEVRDTLLAAAATAGLGSTEAARTIVSGLKAGKAQPRDLSGIRELNGPNVTEVAALILGSAEVTPDASPEDAERVHQQLVAERVRQLRVDRDARALLATEGRPVKPFDAGTLAEILARPPEPVARVENLMPWQASTLIVAQRKTGKTTLVLNLARVLLAGGRFLGSFPVRPVQPEASVAFLNYEVSAAQLARWVAEVGVPVDRLFVVNLRGTSNPLATQAGRAGLADLLRSHNIESLIVDPFGRAYTGEDQNKPGEVGAWLADLDRFAREEVGALDLILTAHAGWQGERSRGASALEDWPDSIVTLTRDDDTGSRFIRATGRDVDLEEDRLDFDPDTRTLSLSGTGGRKVAAARTRTEDTEQRILTILGRDENRDGLSGEGLANLADTDKDGSFTRIRNALVDAGHIVKVKRSGRGGGWLYALPDAEPPGTSRNSPDRDLPNLPNPTSIRGVRSSGMFEGQPPGQEPTACAQCGRPNEPDRSAAGLACLDCYENRQAQP